MKCENPIQHNPKNCPFYHSNRDRKRQPCFYSSQLCEHIENNRPCPQKENCPYSHNFVEQIYRTSKYKTKFCSKWPDRTHECDYGYFCGYAHHEQEIKVTLIHNYVQDDDFFMFHFKTIFCPFNLFEHDRSQCVYAHNWQDFRRKLSNVQYHAMECQKWKHQCFLTSYQIGCENGHECMECHGWKEYDYHPLRYRTLACQQGTQCPISHICPFYHDITQKRIINPYVINNIFIITERNRSIHIQQ